MNANRLISMVLRMVLRKGINQMMKGQRGGLGKQGQDTAKRVRQTQRLTRKL
ncbi:MAG: hypothetical protein QNJ13_12335 [Paracoccaceae bacterium]|nr:hypothetical protein [Paracoccaceae bacterium]